MKTKIFLVSLLVIINSISGQPPVQTTTTAPDPSAPTTTTFPMPPVETTPTTTTTLPTTSTTTETPELTTTSTTEETTPTTTTTLPSTSTSTETPEPTTTTEETTTTTTTTTTPPTTTTTTITTTTPIPGICDDHFGETIPHPDDCAKYIICVLSVPQVVQCDPNSIFNADQGRCLPGNHDTCEFYPCCVGRCDGIFFQAIAIPENTRLFLGCIQEEPFIMECDEGEFFDEVLGKCA